MVNPRTRRPLVSLTVTSPRRGDEAPRELGPTVPWFVASVLGSLAAVAVGWLAVGIIASAAWLTATRTPIASLLELVGQGWLASLGARARLGDLVVSVPPLGITALSVAGVAVATHWAGLQLPVERPRWRDLGALVAASAGTYALGALVLASLVGSATQATAALGGAALVGLVGAGVGGVRALALDPFAALPGWVRRLPGAMGAGVAALAAGSALALTVGLVQRWGLVQQLHTSLAPDAVGSALLVLLYLAYLPTMLAWAGAYALGAGIGVGTGSLVVPGSSTLGLLPGLPPFAALPPGGTVFDWGWLLVGVAAGTTSGLWFCRRDLAALGRPRWTTWPWQGALAGLGAALGWIAWGWLSRGDLGTARLVGMGPVFPDLVWFTLVPLVGGAGLASLVAALVVARRAPGASAEATGEATREPVPTLAGAGASEG